MRLSGQRRPLVAGPVAHQVREPFLEHIIDALLHSRVFVIYASTGYFSSHRNDVVSVRRRMPISPNRPLPNSTSDAGSGIGATSVSSSLKV